MNKYFWYGVFCLLVCAMVYAVPAAVAGDDFKQTLADIWGQDSAKTNQVTQIVDNYTKQGDSINTAALRADLQKAGVQSGQCLDSLCSYTQMCAQDLPNPTISTSSLAQDAMISALDDIFSNDRDNGSKAQQAVDNYINGNDISSNAQNELSSTLKECGILNESSIVYLQKMATAISTDNFADVSTASVAVDLHDLTQNEYVSQVESFVESSYGDTGDAICSEIESYLSKGDSKEISEFITAVEQKGMEHDAASNLGQLVAKLDKGTCNGNDIAMGNLVGCLPSTIKTYIESDIIDSDSSDNNTGDLQPNVEDVLNEVKNIKIDTPDTSGENVISTAAQSQLANLQSQLDNFLPSNISQKLGDKINDIVKNGQWDEKIQQVLVQQMQSLGIGDQGTQQAMVQVLDMVFKGNATANDLMNIGTQLGASYIENLLDTMDIPSDAKDTIRQLIQDGSISGLKDLAVDNIKGILAQHGVSQDVIDSLGQLIEKYTNQVNALTAQNVISDLKEMTVKKMVSLIDGQLQKLCEKYPFMEKIFSTFGISGTSVSDFITNLKWSDVKTVFNNIISKNWQVYKDVFKNLAGKVVGILTDLSVKYIGKWIDKALDKVFAQIEKILKGNKLGQYLANLLSSNETTVKTVITTGVQSAIEKQGKKWQYIITQ